MATEQGIRLSSSWRKTFGNLVRLIPAVVVIAATLSTLSCGSSGLLGFSDASGSGGGSPTSTATAGTGALAFVTNFNDGMVSSFTRNTTTGALTLTGQVTAGAAGGPRGVLALPAGTVLYVANSNDDNIYEFLIDAANGTLSSLLPKSVSNGNGSGPNQLAISLPGNTATLVWVTGSGNGTVTSYVVSQSTGQLKSNGPIGGFNTPFGITLHPTLHVLYVSDTTTGLIQPMTYNFENGVLTKNFPAVQSSSPLATKPAAMAIDAGGDTLFTADNVTGEVSSFSIDQTGATCGLAGCLTPAFSFSNSSNVDASVGVGIAVNTGIEFLFTANQGGNSLSSFVATGTSVNVPPTVATGFNAPTGLVVDPQAKFVYTADNLDGTVSQSTINGSCGSQICAGPLVSTESPAKANSGPYGITLAQ